MSVFAPERRTRLHIETRLQLIDYGALGVGGGLQALGAQQSASLAAEALQIRSARAGANLVLNIGQLLTHARKVELDLGRRANTGNHDGLSLHRGRDAEIEQNIKHLGCSLDNARRRRISVLIGGHLHQFVIHADAFDFRAAIIGGR